MKYLLVLFLFATCTEKKEPVNPKVAIVDRQKEIKVRVNALVDSANKYPLPNDFFEKNTDPTTPHPHLDFLRQATKLEKEYDSLSFELRKY